MSTYLIHHGIKGQKWGVRRFQNPDGSLTEAGRKRYSRSDFEYSETNKWGDNKFRSKDGATIKTEAKEVGEKAIEAMNSADANLQDVANYLSEHDVEIDATGTLMFDDESYELALGHWNDYFDERDPEYTVTIEDGKRYLQAVYPTFDWDTFADGTIETRKIEIKEQGEKKPQKQSEETEQHTVDWDDFTAGDRAKKDAKMTPEIFDNVTKIKDFEPSYTKKVYEDINDVVEDFNRQFDEKFGDIDLNDHQELVDAYDDAFWKFFDNAVTWN